MYSVKTMPVLKTSLMVGLSLLLAGCSGTDLNPSGADQRPAVVAGSTGNQVGQKIANFSLQDSLNNTWNLADHLVGGAVPADAIVLYFTMWCPICMSHTDHMLFSVIPSFSKRGTTQYVLVDYVSGSSAGARASELANGYGGSPYVVLSDQNQALMNQLNAAMGSTIVINRNGIILMNEDYRNGATLSQTLNGVLP